MAMRNDGGRGLVLGAIVGGLLLGAIGFGTLHGLKAQPIPEPPPLPIPSGGPLPVPAPDKTPWPEPAGDRLPEPGLPMPAPLPVVPTGGAEKPTLPDLPVAPPTAPKLPPLDPTPLPSPAPGFDDKKPVEPKPLPKPVPLPEPKLPEPTKPLPPVLEPIAPPPVDVKPVSLPKESFKPELLPEPRKIDGNGLPAPRAVDTIDSVVLPTSTIAPGDAPMPLGTKKAALAAALGVAMTTAQPVSLMADEKKPEPTTPLPVKADEKALQAALDRIKALEDDLKLLKAKKDEYEKLLKGDLFGTTKSDVGVLKRLEKVEADLKAANAKIDDLEKKLATKQTVEKTPLAPKAGKANVVIVNEFKTRISILINGKSHQLDSSETKTVQVDEGELKYELLDFPDAKPKTTTVKEGETITLRVN